ncbi:Cytochrome c oxidase subunit VIb, partial [Arabidopsis thaliana x Arabidopsis arenosa]
SLASSASSRRHRTGEKSWRFANFFIFNRLRLLLSLSLPNQAFSSFVFRSAMEDEIELKTAPADFRFPTTNQTRHCFTRYIEFHRCTTAKGEDSNECERFAKYYRALCPGEWVDKWNEQRETGTFPGPL